MITPFYFENLIPFWHKVRYNDIISIATDDQGGTQRVMGFVYHFFSHWLRIVWWGICYDPTDSGSGRCSP